MCCHSRDSRICHKTVVLMCSEWLGLVDDNQPNSPQGILLWGGTDIDGFSNSHADGGKVVSLALDKYIYVIVNRRFDNMVRVSYSALEIVDDFENLNHELVREAMRITGVTSGVEITTIADIPSRGTGLGSSSTVTVGLLNALHKFSGHDASPEQLAEEACKIEIDILGQPMRQADQYAIPLVA